MQISIAERLRPFCHLPGTATILPGSSYQVQVFPCLVRFFDLTKNQPLLLGELNLYLKGPVEEFTVFNDLEKGRITVSGKTVEGWVRYHLMSGFQGKGIRIFVEKVANGGVTIEIQGRKHSLSDKESLDLLQQTISFEPYKIPTCDRLSLGNHKGQDWELIKRRFDLAEMLPLVHRLGQLIPRNDVVDSQEGTLALLENCRESLISQRPEKGEQTWRLFLQGCFHSLLVPRLDDWEHQGLVNSRALVSTDISPLILLSEGARLIRDLFIQQTEEQLLILPLLFPSFHCGRLVNVSLACGGKISLEWTKKTIRRVAFFPGRDQECHLQFRSDVRSYRLRCDNKDKEKRVSCQTPLLLKKNCYYMLDNFQ